MGKKESMGHVHRKIIYKWPMFHSFIFSSSGLISAIHGQVTSGGILILGTRNGKRLHSYGKSYVQ